MAQITELSTIALPGPRHTFLAKSEGAAGIVTEWLEIIGAEQGYMILAGAEQGYQEVLGADDRYLKVQGN